MIRANRFARIALRIARATKTLRQFATPAPFTPAPFRPFPVCSRPAKSQIFVRLELIFGKGLRTVNFQGRKRNPNLNFLVRIFSGGVGVFHVNGWGPKSSIRPSKPGKSNFLGGISRDFAGISRGRPKSLRKKKVCVQFPFPKLLSVFRVRRFTESPEPLH